MIVRAWLVVGILIISVAWYLTVVAPPPTTQATAQTSIDGYREAGLLPQVDDLKLSTEIGHDVFELPLTDADHLAEELAAQMGSMPGMAMDGDVREGDADAMEGMAMGGDVPEGADAMEGMAEGMAMGGAVPEGSADAMEGMTEGMAMGGDIPEGAADAMEGMAEGMAMGGAVPEGADAMEGMAEGMATGGAVPEGAADAMEGMAEGMAMDDDHAAEAEEAEGGHAGGGGIKIATAGSADRTIEIEMTEWGYSPSTIMVKADETVRFVVTNSGNTPHEFMIMTGPGMASVGYRIQRADWNLTEHEAIFENPLVMPGDTFETVLKIEQPGAWMFMCMFPFHMQLGMMGAIMTEGMEGMSMEGMQM